MSCNYASGLSPYRNKGKLGIAEKFDDLNTVKEKVKILARWFNESKHVVIHTGAGISTSAGIPDFRGPKGVWTLEKKGEKPSINVSFNEAKPTKTHMAIVKLVQAGKVKFVVSQNIDGLHLRSGLPRTNLAELHGNMFIEQCHQCQRQFVRTSATLSVGQKCLDMPCPTSKSNGRPCRGKLHDCILDWEHNLPEKDLGLADFHSCLADLSICLGTTLQIVPSGILPLNTKKYNSGRLVICNLQPTKYDKRADLLIHSYVDDIMTLLMDELNLSIPEYDSKLDPSCRKNDIPVEWTIPESEVKRMRLLYEKNCCKSNKKRVENKVKNEIKESSLIQREASITKCAIKNVEFLKEKNVGDNNANNVRIKRSESTDRSENITKKVKLTNEDGLSVNCANVIDRIKSKPNDLLKEETPESTTNHCRYKSVSSCGNTNIESSQSNSKPVSCSNDVNESNEESLRENDFGNLFVKKEVILC